MTRKEDDWTNLIAGIAGGVIGAGATAAALNKQIQALQSQLKQWQAKATQMQAERDQFAGKAAYAEAQLRQLKDSESRLRVELARLSRLVEELKGKK